MAFGQNIEEITLKVRAEGRADLDALKGSLRQTMESIDRLWGSVARGDDAAKNMKEIAAKAREAKLLNDAINALDPSYQKWIQNSKDLANALAESERKQAEAAKKLAADRIEAAERILAAEKLANQKAKALDDEEVARRAEASERILAAGALAAQKQKALSDAEIARRTEAAEKILAAESLANQKQKALVDEETARREEAAARILAAGALAAQKQKALDDEEVARRTEAAERILAAESLAAQKQKALEDAETSRRADASERILAAGSLAAQKQKALDDEEVARRTEAAERILAAGSLAAQKQKALEDAETARRAEAAEKTLAAGSLAAQKQKALDDEEVARRNEASEKTLAAGALAAQKQKALLDAEMTRREEAAARILAAESLDNQKQKALSDAEVATRTEAAERILAAERLAEQKRESLAADAEASAKLRTQRQEAVAKQAFDAMMKYGFGKDDPFWSSKKIEGTYEQAKAYQFQKDQTELLNKAHDRGHESAKKFSYGLLNVAHAFQDAQYGMGAVLNNIPLVVQAFGGGPGLAGTIMIAGVVIDQTMPKIQQFAREMGMIRDPAIEGGRTVDALKEKINALVEKPWKVDLDYRSIEKGKAELDLLEGRLKAFQAAVSKQTPIQEKSGKAVLGAVSEFAGEEGEAGGGANLGRIVTEMAKLGGDSSMLSVETNRSPDMKRARELRAGIATTQGLIHQGVFQPDELDAIRMQMQRETGEATSLEAKARADANQRILADTVGASLRGNPEAIDRMIGLLDRPEAQALMRGNVGLGIKPVDPKFMPSLRDARPAEIRRSEAEDKANINAADLMDREVERIKKAKEVQRKREEDETRQFTKQGRVGEDAADEAERIKGFMGAQVEFKPLEPFRRAVSPYERRQQALGRRLQSQQAATREQGMGLAQEVAQANPGMAEQQVMHVAGTANRLMANGWNRQDALTEAMIGLQREMMQTMTLIDARQQGFMGSVGQLRQQNRRFHQRRNTLMPSPIPGRQR